MREAGARLAAADILTESEEQVVCCHAEQTKIWSDEPQGLRWEWYVITDDAPAGVAAPASGAATPACCDGQAADTAVLATSGSVATSTPACCDV